MASDEIEVTLLDFANQLDAIYAMYIECVMGIQMYAEKINGLVRAATTRKNSIFYGNSDPNAPGATYQHKSTLGKIIDRNRAGGFNSANLAKLTIIAVYTLWDSEARPRLSRLNGSKVESIKSDVFGDLRNLRNAFVHNSGVLERPLLVLPLTPGPAPIVLSNEIIHSIFELMIGDLNRLCNEMVGKGLDIQFHKQI